MATSHLTPFTSHEEQTYNYNTPLFALIGYSYSTSLRVVDINYSVREQSVRSSQEVREGICRHDELSFSISGSSLKA